MPLWKTRAYKLTEEEIRYAMSKSNSNRAAAKFLNIAYSTYKRYALMYMDEESGKTLWELHKNEAGWGTSKGRRSNASRYKLDDVLAGKHPEYSGKTLKRRLISEGYRVESCERCGFEERRITDYSVPLILVWEDGDKSNHANDNLKLLCYNCFYLTMGSLFKQRQIKIDRADFEGY